MLLEMPWVGSEEPISFQLGGRSYENVTEIDPRIERWPDQETKLKFFRFIIGTDEQPQQPIYFKDDNGEAFEIRPQGYQTTVRPHYGGEPSPEVLMPPYWFKNAVFRMTDDTFHDNMTA